MFIEWQVSSSALFTSWSGGTLLLLACPWVMSFLPNIPAPLIYVIDYLHQDYLTYLSINIGPKDTISSPIYLRAPCPNQGILTKGKAQYSWPPNWGSLFCKKVNNSLNITKSWSKRVSTRRLTVLSLSLQ